MKEIVISSSNVPTTNNLFNDIRSILASAREHAAKVVNSDMVTAYWLIGRRIVIEEQNGAETAKYGEQILQNLSKKLEAEYGNGFSYANLRNMRQFYRTYPDEQICYTLCINSVLNESQQMFALKYLPYMHLKKK